MSTPTSTPSVPELGAAIGEVLLCTYRWAIADLSDGNHRDADADLSYATERLCVAARDLAAVVDRLPADEQPVGWTP